MLFGYDPKEPNSPKKKPCQTAPRGQGYTARLNYEEMR